MLVVTIKIQTSVIKDILGTYSHHSYSKNLEEFLMNWISRVVEVCRIIKEFDIYYFLLSYLIIFNIY